MQPLANYLRGPFPDYVKSILIDILKLKYYFELRDDDKTMSNLVGKDTSIFDDDACK
jgi:hypothetical protein